MSNKEEEPPKEITSQTVHYKKVEPKRGLFSRIVSPIEKLTRPHDPKRDRLEA